MSRINNFRSWIMDADLTQREIAERMGKSKSQVGRYYSDENGIPLDVLADFLDAIGLMAVPKKSITLDEKKYEALLTLSREALSEDEE